MNRVRSIFAALALLLLSCNFVESAFHPAPTPTASEPETVSDANCPGPDFTQAEIDAAIQFDDKYFPSSDWSTSYTVMDYRISVTRKNTELGALAVFDKVAVCETSNTLLDDYYVDDTFDVIFQYYEGNDLQRDCRFHDLRLYEFELKDEGIDYNARYWVEMLSENSVRESLLVFPVKDLDNLNSYSEMIMPVLVSCE